MSSGKKTFDIIEGIRSIKKCMCCFGLDCSKSFNIPEALEEIRESIEQVELPDGDLDQVLTMGSNNIPYWNTVKYVGLFEIGDWAASTITIPGSVHGKGLHPMIQVFRGSGFSFREEDPNDLTIQVSTNGDIILTSSAVPDAFTGKIIII